VGVHRIVGEHEAHPLMLAQRLIEGGAPPRVIGGDVVSAACRTEPAHAMGQPRLGEPHLGVARGPADLPSTALSGTLMGLPCVRGTLCGTLYSQRRSGRAVSGFVDNWVRQCQ
jgi:hypothetical protein